MRLYFPFVHTHVHTHASTSIWLCWFSFVRALFHSCKQISAAEYLIWVKPWEGEQSVAFLSPKEAQFLSSGRKAHATRPPHVVPASGAAVSFSRTKTRIHAGHPGKHRLFRDHKCLGNPTGCPIKEVFLMIEAPVGIQQVLLVRLTTNQEKKKISGVIYRLG